MKCLLENRLGILGSEYQRVDQEIEELEDQLVAGEAACGRIADADIAAEATEFAKQSIKSDLAAQVMVNASRLKDVLIPLTTEHFRSSVLSAEFNPTIQNLNYLNLTQNTSSHATNEQLIHGFAKLPEIRNGKAKCRE